MEVAISGVLRRIATAGLSLIAGFSWLPPRRAGPCSSGGTKDHRPAGRRFDSLSPHPSHSLTCISTILIVAFALIATKQGQQRVYTSPGLTCSTAPASTCTTMNPARLRALATPLRAGLRTPLRAAPLGVRTLVAATTPANASVHEAHVVEEAVGGEFAQRRWPRRRDAAGVGSAPTRMRGLLGMVFGTAWLR